jgi:hypothetical protein
VVIVAGTGYVLVSGGGYGCDEAVPEVDGAGIGADLPVFHEPADLFDGVGAVVGDEDLPADVLDAYRADAGPMLDPGAPFAGASLVVLDPPQWWVGPDGDMYFAGGGFAGARFTVTVHDGDDGQLRWARGQEGITAGGGPADDDDFLLMQTDTDRPLSVAVLDPTSGEVRACTPVGTAEDGAAAGNRIPLSATIDDTVVLAQPGDDDRPSTLYLLDPYPAGGDEVGVVEWGRPVAETDRIGALDGSEEVIAFGGVENDINERYRLGMQQSEADLAVALEAGRLAVHAVAPDDGEPLWSYPADVDAGVTDAEAVPHTLLGVSDGVVVVTADRHGAGGADGNEGDVMVTTVVGLAALTGEQLWSVELSQPGTRTFPDVQLFGDVVVGKDWRTGAGSGDLVALDAATGQARWRIADRTTGLDRGTLVGDQLLLPGLSFQGLEVVDIGDGQARTVVDGLSVGQIKSTGGAIGVEIYIGDRQAVVRYELE